MDWSDFPSRVPENRVKTELIFVNNQKQVLFFVILLKLQLFIETPDIIVLPRLLLKQIKSHSLLIHSESTNFVWPFSRQNLYLITAHNISCF